MSSKIRILDDHTINKIAAGEVIENPASVVKELVENAVDAGSTDICVEIKGGGRQLIRVSDNGCGMSSDDALLCFERHATSKIQAVEDIFLGGTLGFRGEAIPSIASISKLTLLSCQSEKEEGTLVIVEGGRILKSSPVARSPGTTFEVKSLFFNIPVRKKFQRSPTYDANEILKVLTVQALAHPQIKFQLINNQKNVFSANLPQGETFNDRLSHRIKQVLGSDYYAGCCPVDREREEYTIRGYVGLPGFTRHNRTGQYFFVNKRAVFSPMVSYAIREGYGTTLSTNRHPIFVLHLSLPGSFIDVNVHPQKREVRFHQNQALKEMMILSIEEALQQTSIDSSPSPIAFTTTPSFANHPSPITPVALSSSPTFPNFRELEKNQPVQISKNEEQVPMFSSQQKPQPSSLRVIATLHGYLLSTNESGTIKLVDQRAAHARILYEQLLAYEEKKQGIPVQNFLIPYTLEVTPVEYGMIKENLENLHQLGIQIEKLGKKGFIIHAAPQMWSEKNLQQLIIDIVQELQNYQSSNIVKQERNKQVAIAASHAAISQKKLLSLQEGQYLVQQLLKCSSPQQCPQGKPTMIEMTKEQIAKQFHPKRRG